MKTFIKILAILLITVTTSYSQVTQGWAQRFTTTGNQDETVHDIFVDAQGNVYVTGSQKGPNLYGTEAITIKYNSQGVQQWVQNYVPPVNYGASCNAIHVDALGNVYVTGTLYVYGGAWEMLAIKYSPSGTQLWSNRLYYGNTTQGFDLITDNSGNVYVTGLTASGAGSTFLAKYGSSGNLINQTSHHIASEGGLKIGLDGAGKIIIGGYVQDNDSLSFLALKYEQNLDLVWATRWGQQVGNQNFGDMAIDNNSNIILVGTSFLSYATVKINPAGVVQWGKLYNNPSTNRARANAVATDGVGNIFVTGNIQIFASPLTADVATIKYSPSGDEQWVRTLKPTLPPDGYSANDIAIDNSGNAYVTGFTYGAVDIITAKFNAAGTFQWARSYNGPNPNNSSDYGIAVGFDQNGNTYVAGNSTPNDNTTGQDIAIIKYAPVSLFVNEFKKNAVNKSILDNQNTFDTISVDYSLLVNYYVYDVNLKIDTVIHTNDSDLEFYLLHNGVTDTAIYQVGGSGHNFINTVLNDSASTPISGGTAPFTGSYRPRSPLSQFNNMNLNGTWVLKIYDRASGNTGTLNAWSLTFFIGTNPIGIQNISNEIPKQFSLSQNYPNPFNPNSKIKFQIASLSNAKLVVFDILGREVETLVNEQLKPGTYQVDFDGSKLASGVYFYKLETKDFTETKRMVLVK